MVKGIVSRDGEWLQLVPKDRSEEFGVAGAHFLLFSKSFYVLITKRHVLTVSHMIVTLRMMSDSLRSSSVINAGLPIDLHQSRE
jgi:hypothetical protein